MMVEPHELTQIGHVKHKQDVDMILRLLHTAQSIAYITVPHYPFLIKKHR